MGHKETAHEQGWGIQDDHLVREGTEGVLERCDPMDLATETDLVMIASNHNHRNLGRAY